MLCLVRHFVACKDCGSHARNADVYMIAPVIKDRRYSWQKKTLVGVDLLNCPRASATGIISKNYFSSTLTSPLISFGNSVSRSFVRF